MKQIIVGPDARVREQSLDDLCRVVPQNAGFLFAVWQNNFPNVTISFLTVVAFTQETVNVVSTYKIGAICQCFMGTN